MIKGLKELLKKKAMKGEFMDEKKKGAMSSVINDLDDIAEDALSKNMQKVTVASDSKEGLQKGLEKAEEVLEDPELNPEEADAEGRMVEEEMEDEMMSDKEMVDDESYDKTPDYEDMDEEDDMSDEEIDQMIEILKAKKNRKEMMRDE